MSRPFDIQAVTEEDCCVWVNVERISQNKFTHSQELTSPQSTPHLLFPSSKPDRLNPGGRREMGKMADLSWTCSSTARFQLLCRVRKGEFRVQGSLEGLISFQEAKGSSRNNCNECEKPHLIIDGKQFPHTLCPHSLNCTGFSSTSLQTGHWYFSSNGKTNVTLIFSLGCCWLGEDGLP